MKLPLEQITAQSRPLISVAYNFHRFFYPFIPYFTRKELEMHRRRRGMTLVELLVVITILGIMAGLLIPAIGMVTSAARKSACLANVTNLGKAVMQYESVKRQYPGYRSLVARSNNTGLGANKNVSWTVKILPYYDQEALYDKWDNPSLDYVNHIDQLAPSLNGLTCAEDPTTEPIPDVMIDANTNNIPDIFEGLIDVHNNSNLPVYDPAFVMPWANDLPPYTSYTANAGFHPTGIPNGVFVNQSNMSAGQILLAAQTRANGIFHDLIAKPDAKTSLKDMVDGGGQTILLGENVQSTLWTVTGTADSLNRFASTFVWLYSTDKPLGSGRPVPSIVMRPRFTINGDIDFLVKNPFAPTPVDVARLSSMHQGGANVVYADGHSQFLSQDIDYAVLQSLMTPDNGRSHMPSYSYQLSSGDYVE